MIILYRVCILALLFQAAMWTAPLAIVWWLIVVYIIGCVAAILAD